MDTADYKSEGVLAGRKYISLAIGEDQDTLKVQPQTAWRVGTDRNVFLFLFIFFISRNGTSFPGSSGVCCTCCS